MQIYSNGSSGKGEGPPLKGRRMYKYMISVIVVAWLAGCKPVAVVTPTALTTSPTATLTLSGASMIPSPISSIPANTDAPLPPLEVITAANAGKIQLLQTLQIPGFKKSALSQCSVAFSPDGNLLSGVCYQNTIPVWDAQSGQLIRSLESSPVQEVAIAFSPDGKQIATGGFAGNIRLWDSETGQLLKTIGPLSSPIWELVFSPNGDRLASANFNRSSAPPSIRLWNTSNGDLLWDYKSDDKRLLVLSVDYSPDGKTLAYGTFDSVLILDAEKGTLIKLWPIPNHVGDLAFSADGRFLATGSDDHKIRLWETSNYELQSTLEGHKHYVNGVAFSPDGKLIVSGSHDQKVGIWDVESGQLLNMLEGHENAVLRVAINPAGTLIASISWDGTVRLWGVIGD
jgi:WD40 repeat protein